MPDEQVSSYSWIDYFSVALFIIKGPSNTNIMNNFMEDYNRAY